MNASSTHALAGLGGSTLGGSIVAIISNVGHIDPAIAADWQNVIVGVGGGFLAFVAWFIKWRWPDAPPLPGDIVALVQPGDKPAIAAQVVEPGPPPIVQAGSPPPA